jgi:hypothetical protein
MESHAADDVDVRVRARYRACVCGKPSDSDIIVWPKILLELRQDFFISDCDPIALARQTGDVVPARAPLAHGIGQRGARWSLAR